MLTISQLAGHAGVTVRAVRHYHAVGLLPEPERDHSGYRSYDAASVVRLIKIRTLAEAGVPLARVGELLEAGEEEFAAALAEVDARLRAEIAALEGHRRSIGRLAGGDNLALPPEVVAYLDELRALGVSEEGVRLERDGWILMAALVPAEIGPMMAAKRAALEDPRVTRLYVVLGEIERVWGSAETEPLLVEAADLLEALCEEADAAGRLGEQWPDTAGTGLMDAFADDAHPSVARIRELLAERGWSGWTRLERKAGRRELRTSGR